MFFVSRSWSHRTESSRPRRKLWEWSCTRCRNAQISRAAEIRNSAVVHASASTPAVLFLCASRLSPALAGRVFPLSLSCPHRFLLPGHQLVLLCARSTRSALLPGELWLQENYRRSGLSDTQPSSCGRKFSSLKCMSAVKNASWIKASPCSQ